MVDAVGPIRRPQGRPRKHPKKLHAYLRPTPPRPTSLRRKEVPKGAEEGGIKSKIARKCKERVEKLGQHRWVGWSTRLSWLHHYRRLKVPYERRADIYHPPVLDLGCVLICYS